MGRLPIAVGVASALLAAAGLLLPGSGGGSTAASRAVGGEADTSATVAADQRKHSDPDGDPAS
jgi:hypothetical protein